jgi:hypothetical protein
MADDGRRYLLSAPRGVSPTQDALDPHADHHTIAVYGSDDLTGRVVEAHERDVCVSWQQIDPAEQVSTADTDDTDGM